MKTTLILVLIVATNAQEEVFRTKRGLYQRAGFGGHFGFGDGFTSVPLCQLDHSCNPQIHCEWNVWILGECSELCGTGTQINTRTKKVVEDNGGTCTGQPTEEVECKIKECPVHCQWGPWEVTACDKTCGGGMLTKTREIDQEAKHEGDVCTGESTISESCNVQECPVDCKWGAWEIGDCSVECGGGLQPRFREKTQEALYGGACEGEETDLVECNPDPCPVSTACPEEKSSYCSGYVYYYPQLCKDTPRNQWFLGEDGRYACRKSCGLC